MEIHGTRFGTLEFEEQDVITVKEGLLGFPMSKKYILFPFGDESSFFWLQSLDEAEIAFIVINPFEFFKDLEFSILDADISALGITSELDTEIFTLVTIPEGHPEEMRTNLAGPVVVNAGNRSARQILMKGYSPRQPLIPESLKGKFMAPAEKKSSSS